MLGSLGLVLGPARRGCTRPGDGAGHVLPANMYPQASTLHQISSKSYQNFELPVQQETLRGLLQWMS